MLLGRVCLGNPTPDGSPSVCTAYLIESLIGSSSLTHDFNIRERLFG